jgi:ribonuclease HI
MVSPGASGAGAIAVLPGSDHALPKVAAAMVPMVDGTNNLAELLGLELGLTLICKNWPVTNMKLIAIVTDSKYTIDKLSNHPKKEYTKYGPIIGRIRGKLHKLTSYYKVKVKLIWAGGHVGVPGNECADILATDAQAIANRLASRCWHYPNKIANHTVYYDEVHCEALPRFSNFIAKLENWQQRDYLPP